MVRRESCTVLAGASPVSVSAGAPSSRVQSWVERLTAERTVQGLDGGGGDDAGRNTSERRASLVKISAERCLGAPSRSCRGEGHAQPAQHPVSGLGLPGVWEAARVNRAVRNTRDPSRRLTSSRDRADKAGAETVWSRAGVRGAHSVRRAAHCSGGFKSLRRSNEGRRIRRRG
jgi:hypothetical protein